MCKLKDVVVTRRKNQKEYEEWSPGAEAKVNKTKEGVITSITVHYSKTPPDSFLNPETKYEIKGDQVKPNELCPNFNGYKYSCSEWKKKESFVSFIPA